MIQKERIEIINEHPINEKNQYIIYWMQQSQREYYNHALEFSIELANKYKKPLLVVFVLTGFPEANERHYYFMLEGLLETKKSLEKRNIQFVLKVGNPIDIIEKLALKAVAMVFDKGYLRIQRHWRSSISQRTNCRIFQVESDVIVPTSWLSQKEEYSAGTIRRKINRELYRFLLPLKRRKIINQNRIPGINSEDFSDIHGILSKLNIDTSVTRLSRFPGGAAQGEKNLNQFIKQKIDYYGSTSNDPGNQYQSDLSPYLHFGQISSLYIALRVQAISSPGQSAFLEELIIRRELGFNFVENNPNYDNFACLPHWALKSLDEHLDDKREYLYDRKNLEDAKTHDKYWNAAQKEMVLSGKMHGYMRMYWGKKILQWSPTPEAAFETALALNNKYSLDGRDANSFAGIAWCFGKHDRAWKERPVFGKIRYMNDKGLERKFNMQAYLQRISRL